MQTCVNSRKLNSGFGKISFYGLPYKVDGHFFGNHTGGYAPFTFDITSKLDLSEKEHELLIFVFDP